MQSESSEQSSHHAKLSAELSAQVASLSEQNNALLSEMSSLKQKMEEDRNKHAFQEAVQVQTWQLRVSEL